MTPFTKCRDQIPDWVVDFLNDIFNVKRKPRDRVWCTDEGFLGPSDGSHANHVLHSDLLSEIDGFPSMGFFEDSVCHWQETDWGTLCYVFGLSHFCKCVNGSLNRRCFATVDSDQRPNSPQCKLTVNHFWLRCCPRMPIWPADKPEIRNVTGFPKPAHTRGGVKWKLSMAYQIPKVAILFSYLLFFLFLFPFFKKRIRSSSAWILLWGNMCRHRAIKTVPFVAIYSYLFIYLVEIANRISSYFWFSCVMLRALRYWCISYLTDNPVVGDSELQSIKDL